MQLVRRPRGRAPVRDRLQRSARAAVAGFVVDGPSARQMILEAAEAGARHCGPLAVSTLCAMLSGKYAPAADEGPRAAAERVFASIEVRPPSPSMGGGSGMGVMARSAKSSGSAAERATPNPALPPSRGKGTLLGGEGEG
jgi:hypothetical protein